ncbi:hypothetical protein [Desulfopila sp. IMCC35008]|uniref:hypothetical protein n=1 Tax=Desulfopila sp. IMCC35008 TaxID=2653858 RepID=UPI0013D6A324|nr:hypothetical protein [Desulfopila sp. IMCC35008]
MLTTVENKNMSMSLEELSGESGKCLKSMSEIGWFLLSLMLFMMLGPFAGPIALIAVFTCQKRDDRKWLEEPECAEQV